MLLRTPVVFACHYCRVSCFLQPFDKFGKVAIVYAHPIRNIKQARTRAISLPRMVFDCVIGTQFKILKTHGCRGGSYSFHILCRYDFRKVVQSCFLRSLFCTHIIPHIPPLVNSLRQSCGSLPADYYAPKGRQRTTRSVASKRWQGREPTCTTGRLSPERP